MEKNVSTIFMIFSSFALLPSFLLSSSLWSHEVESCRQIPAEICAMNDKFGLWMCLFINSTLAINQSSSPDNITSNKTTLLWL